jgi:hypothetical protein
MGREPMCEARRAEVCSARVNDMKYLEGEYGEKNESKNQKKRANLK